VSITTVRKREQTDTDELVVSIRKSVELWRLFLAGSSVTSDFDSHQYCELKDFISICVDVVRRYC